MLKTLIAKLPVHLCFVQTCDMRTKERNQRKKIRNTCEFAGTSQCSATKADPFLVPHPPRNT